MLVVIMGMLIFSGLAYVSEKDEPETKFISMPQVRWRQSEQHNHKFACLYPRPCTGLSSQWPRSATEIFRQPLGSGSWLVQVSVQRIYLITAKRENLSYDNKSSRACLISSDRCNGEKNSRKHKIFRGSASWLADDERREFLRCIIQPVPSAVYSASVCQSPSSSTTSTSSTRSPRLKRRLHWRKANLPGRGQRKVILVIVDRLKQPLR